MQIKEILSYLKDEGIRFTFIGDENAQVERFSSLTNYKLGSFTWIKTQKNIPEDFDLSHIALGFVAEGVTANIANVIYSPESKHAFFSTIEHFFSPEDDHPAIGQFTYLSPKVKLGKNVRIGHNCTLDGDIEIGDNTIIWNGVTIINHVRIGHDTEIQSGCVIGHDGFGYSEDEKHKKTMVRHFGGVEIGNHVLISSNVCICRGTIDNTVIEDGVKIDNMSHIAHNCHMGPDSALAYPCWLGGSSTIESNGYVAAGVIRNQCTVHRDAFVGMGAIVTKDVPAGQIVVGNPAKPYKKT